MNPTIHRPRSIRQVAQNFLNFFPPELIAKLPKLKFLVGPMKAVGSYGDSRVKINWDHHTENPNDLITTIFHEMMHWIHLEGGQEYRDAIKKHFDERTAGEVLKLLPGYWVPGLKDGWYNIYAGRVYQNRADGRIHRVPNRWRWDTCRPEFGCRVSRVA